MGCFDEHVARFRFPELSTIHVGLSVLLFQQQDWIKSLANREYFYILCELIVFKMYAFRQQSLICAVGCQQLIL